MAKRAVDKDILKVMHVKVRGVRWRIELWKDASFKEYWPGELAHIEFNTRYSGTVMRIRKTGLSKNTIAHELTHANLRYVYTRKSSQDGNEEAFANMIGRCYSSIYNLTNKIYKELIK